MRRIEIDGYTLNADAVVGVGPVHVPANQVQQNGCYVQGYNYAVDLLFSHGRLTIPFITPGGISADEKRAHADTQREIIVYAVFGLGPAT